MVTESKLLYGSKWERVVGLIRNGSHPGRVKKYVLDHPNMRLGQRVPPTMAMADKVFIPNLLRKEQMREPLDYIRYRNNPIY